MKVITLRKIPREIARPLMARAQSSKISSSRAIIEILEDAFGVGRKKKAKVLYHDLDHLFGKWSEGESAHFNSILKKQRKIDRPLWR